jgi:hypothetical protein
MCNKQMCRCWKASSASLHPGAILSTTAWGSGPRKEAVDLQDRRDKGELELPRSLGFGSQNDKEE